MRTLFVTVDPAFPPISGVDLRAWQNVKAASALGPVLLLSIGCPGGGMPPSGIAIGHLGGMRAAEVWRGDFDVAYPADTIDRLRTAAAKFRPDAIVLESLPLTNLADAAKGCCRALVMDLHNVESEIVAQLLQRTSDANTHRAIECRVERLRSVERRAEAVADLLWVCSSVDRDRLRNDGFDANRICVVANGVPDPYPAAIGERERHNALSRRPALLFIGHLSYRPNVEACLSLMALMPALWRRIPDARLVLAGRNPHPAILRRSQPGMIDVIANPGSIAPLLASADLAVMPIQRGGGTRIKALEAMAWGLPLVATARAVEGLNVENGIHASIAETDEAFVAAICKLCDEPLRYESQRLAARAHVMTLFGPQAIQAAVHAGLRRATRPA